MIDNMDEDEFKKYVALLNSISFNTNNVEYLDLSQIFEANRIQSLSYNEALSILNKIEGKKYIKKEVNIPQAVKEEEKIQPHLISSGLQQAQYTQVVQTGATQAPTTGGQIKIPSGFSKIKEKIASVKEGMSRGNKSRIVREKISIKDLVLPSLSVSDQVSELERIIEGLKEKVFDQEHLEIVAEEIYGLQMVVESEKKTKKEVSELEQSLIALRNQRLADALAILSKYESGS